MLIVMKAVQISAYGGNEVLTVNANAPEPTPGTGQVLIEAHTSSINPFDLIVRAGFVKDAMPLQFPATLGGDIAGVVTKLGEGVTDFKVGDEIYGQAIVFAGGSGSWAEVVVANVNAVSRKPKAVSFLESGALPLTGVSAVQALTEHMKLATDPASAEASAGKQKILIHGGAGGIGTIAIQLAKHLGAFVATTVRAEDKTYVTELGADQVIDYQSEKFEDIVQDADAVFDTVGGEVMTRSFAVLKKGGVLVSMKGRPDPALAKQYGVTSIGQFTQTTTERLVRLAGLVDQGAIKVHIDKVFPLDDIRAACEYFEQGHPRGKVALKIKE